MSGFVVVGPFDEDRDLCHALDRLADRRVRVIRPDPGETVEDALHRRLGELTLRGSLLGAAVFAVLTALGAIAIAGADPAAAAGLGLAVGLTGGPFFGSFAAFASALHFNQAVRNALDVDLSTTAGTLVAAWPDDGKEAEDGSASRRGTARHGR